VFLISKFRRVLNVVCFLLGNSPASEFYVSTFRNTLFHLHRWVGMKNSSYLPAYEDGTECSETSAYKIQTPGNYPEESIQHLMGTYTPKNKYAPTYWTDFSLHLRDNIQPKDDDTFLRITFHCFICFIVSFNCILISYSSFILNFPDK